MLDYLKTVLVTLGWKEDAKYTAVLEKQLEYLKTKMYEVIYPEMMARVLIPVSNEADPGAETITYSMWDQFGMAQVIANFADDPPMVEALVEDYPTKVKSFGSGYQFSLQDLRRAAMAGVNLTDRKARAARRMQEQKVEETAATGDAKFGLTGLANNANVSLTTPITGTWSGATAAQIIADLDKLVGDIYTRTKGTMPADTVALDHSLYKILAQKRVSTTGDTNRTIIQDYLESSPWIKEIKPWYQLATADAAGTGPRIVAYKKDPDVLTLEIPQEYEQLPPQAKNYAFVVPTHMRCAGVIMPYPMAVGYMDGC
jgi:hypothetical protein